MFPNHWKAVFSKTRERKSKSLLPGVVVSGTNRVENGQKFARRPTNPTSDLESLEALARTHAEFTQSVLTLLTVVARGDFDLTTQRNGAKSRRGQG
jgi:hypothetical protein